MSLDRKDMKLLHYYIFIPTCAYEDILENSQGWVNEPEVHAEREISTV